MKRNLLWMIIAVTGFLLTGCNDDKKNTRNTFYVVYHCKNDSLLNELNKATAGKVSYYDNEKQFQVISLNYVTEDHPRMHYYSVESEIPARPQENSIKYDVEFNDSMINDSIAYSLKKFIYKKEGWKQKSDMGTIKVFEYLSERDKNLPVIKQKIAAKVFKVIANDTYSK